MRGSEHPAEYTKQLRALETYAQEHPNAGYARFLLAYHYLVLNSKDTAIAQFKEVVRLQPDDKLSVELLNALTSGESSAQPVPAK